MVATARAETQSVSERKDGPSQPTNGRATTVQCYTIREGHVQVMVSWMHVICFVVMTTVRLSWATTLRCGEGRHCREVTPLFIDKAMIVVPEMGK